MIIVRNSPKIPTLYYLQIQVPVNMTRSVISKKYSTKKSLPPMQDPWTRVVGTETNGNIVCCAAKGNNIPSYGVLIVVGRATGAPDNIKCMLRDLSQLTNPD